MAKSKTKKVTAKELAQVKELQSTINTVLVNLGNADVVKAQLLTKHEEAQADWKKMTTELEKKYGNVNISLEDGSISEVKEKEAKVAEAV
jgi:predicted DNA binding CopG/RHH family protein